MIRHQKGHKNSKGEKAEWVIVSHKDGHVISSHTSKEAAQKHLKDIQKFKHMKESIEYTEDSIYDRLVGYGFDPGDLNEFFKHYPIEDFIRALSFGKMSFSGLIRKIEIWMGWETEELEEAAEDGHISRWDRNKIFKGIAPTWAKKVTTVGPKPKRPETAVSHSELAMKKVTEPNYRKYTETDLKNDKAADTAANQRIADMISKKIDLPIAVTAESITIDGNEKTYEIIPYGFVYKVRVRKGLDKEMVEFERIFEVIDFIKQNETTMGESMKLTEAKQILKKNGAKLIKESHEDDIRTNNEAFSFLYKLKNDFEELFDKLDSKAKDYINGHVSDNDWEAFLWENGQDIRLNSIRMGKIGEVLKTLVNR